MFDGELSSSPVAPGRESTIAQHTFAYLIACIPPKLKCEVLLQPWSPSGGGDAGSSHWPRHSFFFLLSFFLYLRLSPLCLLGIPKMCGARWIGYVVRETALFSRDTCYLPPTAETPELRHSAKASSDMITFEGHPVLDFYCRVFFSINTNSALSLVD